MLAGGGRQRGSATSEPVEVGTKTRVLVIGRIIGATRMMVRGVYRSATRSWQETQDNAQRAHRHDGSKSECGQGGLGQGFEALRWCDYRLIS